MTRVKLCGLTRLADVLAANRFLPDYAGFVFAPSRRRVTPAQAATLRAALDPRILAVGVFVDEPPERVAALCGSGAIDLVQLHGAEDAAYIAALRRLTAAPIIKSVAVAHTLPPLPTGADYLLFDAATPAHGGAGQRFDWSALAGYSGPPYFLAGGLDCGNVTEAVRALHPHCVDVSSGIETGGRKDPEKMQRFTALVREDTP